MKKVVATIISVVYITLLIIGCVDSQKNKVKNNTELHKDDPELLYTSKSGDKIYRAGGYVNYPYIFVEDKHGNIKSVSQH